MKKSFYAFSVLFFLACADSGGEILQNIDQNLAFYFENAGGKNLLTPNDSLSYSQAIELLDMNGEYDLTKITGNFSVKTDSLSRSYFSYSTGAVRVLEDSISAGEKYYRSDFIIKLSKKQGTQIAVDSDTVSLKYFWSPELFRISEVFYNQKQVFKKENQTKNIVKIVK